MAASSPEWIKKLTRREKAFVFCAVMALAWFGLEMGLKPALAAYSNRRDAVLALESEKKRISAALSQDAELGEKIHMESMENARLKERLSELRERLKSASAINGGGLDFLQSIINSANHASAEMNINSEPVKKRDSNKADSPSAVVYDDPLFVKSRVVLRLETKFRDLASIVNRVETSRLPIVMRRLDVAVESPGADFLKAEIEMDVFSR